MNNMMCDIATGVCGEAADDSLTIINFNQPQQKVDLYYVTDPICSHCWALEPVLRRFEAEYGHHIKLRTVMGGLLQSWDGFADVKNGIGSPADVAGHWREVGEHSRMPIDGSLWLSNPIRSSYPPSRVFKVIQQDAGDAAAAAFLRRAREAVFAFNRNIGEEPVLIELVNRIGLDGAAIVEAAGSPAGQALLEEDFALAGSLGVRGFPTIIMVNEEKKGVKIVGARQLEQYVEGLKQLLPNEPLQSRPIPGLAEVLQHERLLFSKEIEVLYGIEPEDVPSFVERERAAAADAIIVQQRLGEHYYTYRTE